MPRLSALIALFVLVTLPSLTSGEPTTEVELIQEHLASVETHLRARDVSDWPEDLQKARADRLDELRAYRLAGDFPTNNRHPDARVPYFIDDYGTACAVGQLMIDSGAEDLAREIARDENHAYVMEIENPRLSDWVKASGITADEAVWIQPTYGYCMGLGITVSGPTEASCGEQITISTDVTEVPECPSNGVAWGVNESSYPPDAIINDEPRAFDGMNFVSGEELVVQFDPDQEEDFEYVFTATVQNMGDSASATHAVRVDCGEPGWNIDEPDPDPIDGPKKSADEGCATSDGTASLVPLVLILVGIARTRRRSERLDSL